MKAGVVEESGVLKTAERDIPKIGAPDDVIIRVKRTVICGSDIYIYHGKHPFAAYPACGPRDGRRGVRDQ
jgi:threonine dehydrogenase-like Zn-dependent dehydrogenase